MAKTNKGQFYLTLEQCAWMADLSTVSFHEVIRPLIPKDDIKYKGRIVLINARAVHRAIVEHAAASIGGTTDEDSSALEAYRAARAEIAQMDVEERKRTHVPISKLRVALTKFSGRLRRAGEVLQRRFGNDASDVFNEAVDEAAQFVEKDLTVESDA